MTVPDGLSRREMIGTFAAAVPAIAGAPAEAPAEEDAIRRTALDYIEGWYAGDAARMERAVHPELAKRIVMRSTGRRDELEQQSAMTLVLKTRKGIGRSDPRPRSDYRLLDRFGDAAVARIDASDWVDFLHLAKWQGEWKIVNVLWALRAAN